jgi:glycosyltransferase involved in cell wall biosynthesis
MWAMSSRVYILLATYQGQRWLPDLLDSIRRQSCADWTLLVRDDDSSDGTREVLSQAARSDPRIVVAPADGLRRRTVGNFSWLLEQAGQAAADHVLLADQDDVWHADKVARQVAALEAAEAVAGRDVPHLVYCDAAVVDQARRPLHASFLRQSRLPYGADRPLKTLLGRSFMLGCTCGVNRALLKLALPMPAGVASHDWWLSLCAAAAGQVTRIDAALLDYRRHEDNVSPAAFWNLLHARRLGWRRRWEIGWTSFLRSLDQARSLRDRLRERNVAAGEEGKLLGDFCRIIDAPGRWRRIWNLRHLGVPAMNWPRRLLYDACLLRL